MFNRISDLLPRLRIYERLFPTHERLVQSLSKVYFDVLRFCSEAKTMFRRTKRTVLTSGWKPFERHFGSHIDVFRRHQEEMEKEVFLSHLIEAEDSRAVIRSNQMEIARERNGKSFVVTSHAKRCVQRLIGRRQSRNEFASLHLYQLLSIMKPNTENCEVCAMKILERG